MLDLALVLSLLPLWLPLSALTALAVRLFLGSPVFFRQRRAGLRAAPFTLLKFRTMTDRRTQTGELLADRERLTGFGEWLRRTSLDELPEIWNVLRGDLSVVGPRPLPVQYVARYTPAQARRQDVRPGITGLAQVRGRNSLSWDERFRLDVFYADNVWLGLDLEILWQTGRTVLRRKGISAPGQATMQEFLGEGRAVSTCAVGPDGGGASEAGPSQPTKDIR